MISRRNFFTISSLMAIIFFLCMFSNNLKEALNDYTVNPYVLPVEDCPSGADSWTPGQPGEETAAGERKSFRDSVCFIGGEEKPLGGVVREWAACTRRDMASYPSLADYRERENAGAPDGILVIDSDAVDWSSGEEAACLMEYVEQGTHLVFATLPDVSVIAGNRQIQDLLGIRRIVEEETAAAGLHMYEGFLLGGEAVYQPEEEETDGEEREIVFPGDTDASGRPVFPWYLLSSGTKVYMKGIPEDETVDTEEYPVLIWRKSFGTAYVFAVNGGYMDGVEGLGILSALSAQMEHYEIYPVVNAQSMIFTGFPCLADENGEDMERYYSRPMTQVCQEILWPNVWIVLNRYQHRITCMLAPQLDYSDGAQPDPGQLEYYLKTFSEQTAETGLSGISVSGTPVAQKLKEDGEFAESAVGGYRFASFYAGDLPEEEILPALDTGILSSVRTVVTDLEEDDTWIVKFLSDTVTEQKAVTAGLDYTYRSDFLVRSLETALGYLSLSFDMERVAYPGSGADTWEKLSRDLGITASRYGELFRDFDRTTTAECDLKIRSFLALDYEDEREGDQIRLQVKGAKGPAWFLLRIHKETVKDVEGGSFRELEAGTYLIGTEGEEVRITLGPVDERYYR